MAIIIPDNEITPYEMRIYYEKTILDTGSALLELLEMGSEREGRWSAYDVALYKLRIAFAVEADLKEVEAQLHFDFEDNFEHPDKGVYYLIKS